MMYGVNVYGPDPGGFVMEALRSGSFLTPLRTLHLWFLYYLLYFSVAALVLAALVPRIVRVGARAAFDRTFRVIAGSPVRAFILAVPTCATLYFMNSGTLDTNATFVLTPASLIAYSVFFGFGWFLFKHSDLLPSFRKYAWTQVALALALFPINLQYTSATMRALPRYNPESHTIAIVTASVIMWLLIFGFLGLAQRHLSRENKHVRYLADASYWMYLVHLPVVLWLQVALVSWEAPGILKFLAVMVATTAITLGSYSLFVRYSFIGTALNGVRRRGADNSTSMSQAVSA
jgi:peptidoglycan/LPS O-acetylase OafA/YrhL